MLKTSDDNIHGAVQHRPRHYKRNITSHQREKPFAAILILNESFFFIEIYKQGPIEFLHTK